MQNISQMVCVFLCNLHLKRCGLRIAVGSVRSRAMRRPYGRRHKSLQSAFPSAAALHHRSMDPHQCSHFLPLTRSLRHSANCILCLSIKIYFPFLFSFAFYHLLLIPLLLKSSLSLLARVMRAGLLK